MNVGMIATLEQVKSMLSRAYNTAERQLRDPFGDKESVSSYLLTKIQIVTNEIDAFISEEENASQAYYSEDRSTNVNISVEAFPLDDDSDIQAPVKPDGFNPVIHSGESGCTTAFNCASEITAAFGDCWVEVKALKPNGSNPDYMISIQPDGYTPNDIQLKLKSLGYVRYAQQFTS
jgi:hypothetical protein